MKIMMKLFLLKAKKKMLERKVDSYRNAVEINNINKVLREWGAI